MKRRQKLLIPYIINLSSKPQHSTYGHFFRSATSLKHETSLQKLASDSFTNLNLQMAITQPQTYHKIPPWFLAKYSINQDLAIYKEK